MLRFGYRVDEVDLVADKIARFLESGEPVTVDQVRSVAFRMQRRSDQDSLAGSEQRARIGGL